MCVPYAKTNITPARRRFSFQATYTGDNRYRYRNRERMGSGTATRRQEEEYMRERFVDQVRKLTSKPDDKQATPPRKLTVLPDKIATGRNGGHDEVPRGGEHWRDNGHSVHKHW